MSLSLRVPRVASTLAAAVAFVLLSSAAAQGRPLIKQFAVPTPNSQPDGIAKGADGNLWFSETGANKIGRITTTGTVTEFPLSSGSQPEGITSGPDGNVWFTETGANAIGRITVSGQVTEFPVPTVTAGVFRITAGPDGNLWFTEAFADRIGRIAPSGVITEFPSVLPNRPIEDITTGPDGNLWFTVFPNPEFAEIGYVGKITTQGVMSVFPSDPVQDPLGIATGRDRNLWITGPGNDTIGKVTTSGVVTSFSVPGGISNTPEFITSGPDGALWFTEIGLGAMSNTDGNKIGRITLAGRIAQLRVPTPNSAPEGITAGPDGAIWFAERDGGKIGQVTF